MKLHDFIYKIEGELPDGQTLANSGQEIVIAIDGIRGTPTHVSSDGEVLVIDVERIII